MSYFDNATTGNIEGFDQADILNKSLSAGYGVDPTSFSGGRVLIPESLESTLTNVLSETGTDCKMFASLHKQPVKSTVHEVARRTGLGEYKHLTVGEGGTPTEGAQDLSRKIYETKYIETLGKITKQMELAETLEGAYESEKLWAVNRVTLATEHLIFHGDSDIVPTEFDGLVKTINESENTTVVDIHGLELGVTTDNTDYEVSDTGEALLDDIATDVFRKGGDLKRALYSPILAKQFKRLYQDRLRYLTGDRAVGLNELPDINTAIGSTIVIKGREAGADKLFEVKGKVVASGTASLRPNAPSAITVTANVSASDSKFYSNDAGDYVYAVHAVNAYGISAATTSSTVTVAAGGSVTIEITPSTDGNEATGYIITRTCANGSVLMEMVKIPASTTSYTDVNAELPGTASLVLLSNTESMGRNAISWAQLMPLSSIPLPIESNLCKRFVVALYGMLEVRNPEHQALVKNIGYTGGLYSA